MLWLVILFAQLRPPGVNYAFFLGLRRLVFPIGLVVPGLVVGDPLLRLEAQMTHLFFGQVMISLRESSTFFSKKEGGGGCLSLSFPGVGYSVVGF